MNKYMKKKRTMLIVVVGLVFVAALALMRFFPSVNDVTVASDEIRLEIQLDVEKDIGLFIIDRDIAGNDFSGGISNADKSLLKHDELLINNYTKEEFSNVEDLNNLKLRFSIITKYVDPNYENVYPEEYTKVMEPIYIDAKYGETYRFTVTGNSKDGYKSVLENQ
jgi:hypothetical protein